MSGVLAAVDMEDLAGHEVRSLEVEDGVDDVADFAHSTDRMHGAQRRMRLDRMHGSLDDAGGDRIDANTLLGELERGGFGQAFLRHVW